MSYLQFTCKICKCTCLYAASTSCRKPAIARHKARKLQVTSPAGCSLTYLHFAGEFTRGVIADCLQLQVILSAVVGIVACDYAGEFACVCSYFCLKKQTFLHASRGQICMSFACKVTSKNPLYSGKLTCGCRQFACVLREVKLPVFTGKLHVTQVNCLWGLFTCELQVKLPAFARNFARASFTG